MILLTHKESIPRRSASTIMAFIAYDTAAILALLRSRTSKLNVRSDTASTVLAM